MYVLKQIVGLLIYPGSVALLLAAIATVCRLCGKRRTAIWAASLAVTVAYVGSTALCGRALLGPLESRFPPLRADTAWSEVHYILVLGSSYSPHDGIPVTAALQDTGVVRVVEGVRLARRIPGVRLILSGGAPPGQRASAEGYAALALDLGVDKSSITVIDTPLDTKGEASATVALLHQEPFLLVTSASHMPRAMRLMRRAGARPIAAPTGQQVNRFQDIQWSDLLPTSGGLRSTEGALHEYFGLAALSLGVD